MSTHQHVHFETNKYFFLYSIPYTSSGIMRPNFKESSKLLKGKKNQLICYRRGTVEIISIYTFSLISSSFFVLLLCVIFLFKNCSSYT